MKTRKKKINLFKAKLQSSAMSYYFDLAHSNFKNLWKKLQPPPILPHSHIIPTPTIKHGIV